MDVPFRFQLSKHIIVLLVFWLSIDGVSGQAFTVSSSSVYVGAQCNYTFSISNHSNPTQVLFAFNTWSTISNIPYISTQLQVYITSLLLTCTIPFDNFVSCLIPAGSYPNPISIIMTGMYNPSSTKPYPMTVKIIYANGTSKNMSSSLGVSSVSNTTFSLNSYSKKIGTASNVDFTLATNIYLDSNSILALTFNINYLSLSAISTSSYTVTQNSNGTVKISKWINPSSTSQSFTSITITNPQAALTYTINALLYFIDNVTSTQYNIQAYSSTIQLIAYPYQNLSIFNTLEYGTFNNALNIQSICAFTQTNKSVNNTAYTLLAYNSSEISPSNGSNCISQNSSSCTTSIINSNTNYTLTPFTATITSNLFSTVTFTAYTYYFDNYYPLCSSSTLANFTAQSITSIVYNSTDCDSNVVAGYNNITIVIKISSFAFGDQIFITGMSGVVNNTNIWPSATMNGTAGNLLTITATSATVLNSSYISVILTYTNPNYTTLTNSIASLQIYRQFTSSLLKYAQIKSTLALCAVSTPSTVMEYTFTESNANTYEIVSYTLAMKMQLYDYAAADYAMVYFKSAYSSNNAQYNIYALASNYLNATTYVTINGINSTFSLYNQSTLKISFLQAQNALLLPTSNNPTLKIVINNINNPPFQSNISLYLETYHTSTSGIKEVLTTSVLQIVPSTFTITNSNIFLLTNQNVMLFLTKPQRKLLQSNSTTTYTTLKINVPFTCTNVNNNSNTNRTLLLNWNALLDSTSVVANGTSTALNISLGTCQIPYFTNKLTLTVSESNVDSQQSTTTTVSLVNFCGDNCYQCSLSGSTCTKCFNSTNSNYTLLFGQTCFNSCPVGSYILNGQCYLCFSTCSSCNGSTFKDCQSCAVGFAMNSAGICISTCGNSLYISTSTSCTNCQINCLNCLSYADCYVCKTGAILINNYCQFATCTSPCNTCEGSLTNCTSCLSPNSSLYLYSNTCYQECPSNTYPSLSSNGSNICLDLHESIAYVPITIASIVMFLIVIAIRIYSNRKIGNASNKRKRRYSLTTSQILRGTMVSVQAVQPAQEDQPQLNYKINLIRTMAVLMSYFELIGVGVLIAKNVYYSITSNGTNICIIIGLALYICLNVIFGVGYYKIVHRKMKVKNSNHLPELKIENAKNKKSSKIEEIIYEDQDKQNQRQPKKIQNVEGEDQHIDEQNKFDLQKHIQESHELKNIVIVILSCIFTFRTYKILYSNLFVDRNATQVQEIPKKDEEANTNILISTIKADKNNTIKKSKETALNHSSLKKTSFKNKEGLTSKKVEKQEIKVAAPVLLTTTIMKMIDDHEKSTNKKLNHPFLTYLTIISLIGCSMLFLIGSILQIVNYSFNNVLLWGIDALIVIIFSIIVNTWDLWTFVNLTKEEQQSQMSSLANLNQNIQEEVNNTHQNLKQQVQDVAQVQNTINSPKKKSSPKKNSSQKVQSNVKSNRSDKEVQQNPYNQGQVSNFRRKSIEGSNSGSGSEGETKYERYPDLKVFDEIEDGASVDYNFEKKKKLKKWNVGSNQKRDMSKGSIRPHKYTTGSNLLKSTRQVVGNKLDDIYLNFDGNQVEMDSMPVHFHDLTNKLSEKQEKVSIVQIEGAFEPENIYHPNFQEISGIQIKERPDRSLFFEQDHVNANLQEEIQLPQINLS